MTLDMVKKSGIGLKNEASFLLGAGRLWGLIICLALVGSVINNINAQQVSSTSDSVASLAKIDGGGALGAFLSNGRIYFNDSNQGELHSVPIYGGEIVTHLFDPQISPWAVTHGQGKIFGLNARTSGAGHVFSLPETAEGIASLSKLQDSNGFLGHFIDDITTDGTYVYWAERDTTREVSRLFRVPVVSETEGPIGLVCGCSTDQLFSDDLAGIVRIVLDGDVLFVSEGLTGNIYRIDLSAGTATHLASGFSSGFLNTIPLVVTNNYLYALVKGREIFRVDKNTGTATLAATTVLDTGGRDPSAGRIRSDSKAVYWWEKAYPNLLLKRLDDETDSRSTLVTVPVVDGPPGSTVYDFYSDGSQVWWFNNTTGTFFDVQHVPVRGGIPNKIATFDASGRGLRDALAPRSLAGDATDLYWIGQASVVMTLPKSGGEPALLTETAAIVDHLVLTGRHLIWGDFPDGIRKMPKRGPTEFDVLWSATFDETPLDLALDENDLYWLVQHYDLSTTTMTTRLLSMPIAGGVPRDLARLPGNPIRIVPYGDSVFVANFTAGGGSIFSVPKSGGTERTLVVTDPATPIDLHIIDDILYFSLDCYIIEFCSAPTLQRYDLKTGILTTLLDFAAPGEIYVDESHIYWRVLLSGDVQRMPRAGGKIELLASGHWLSGQITGDRDCIYWAAGWEILRLPKSGKQCRDAPEMTASLRHAEGEVGVNYNASLEVSGGFPPHSGTIISGAIPSGLDFNSPLITGIPTQAGTSRFTIQVTDQFGWSASEKFKITIFKALSIATKSLKSSKVEKKHNAALKATGGKNPYSWSLVSGNLPPGLTLSATGKISGTPTVSGNFNLTFQVTDPLGGMAQKTFVLTVK